MQSSPLKIVFFGTSDFAAILLQALLEVNINIVAVVTRPDRPKGRNLILTPCDVKVLAQKIAPHIPLFQPEKASTDAFCQQIKAFSPDLFVVAAYGEIIKENLLETPVHGAINVHGSLLPKYRGAAPIQRALLAGEKKTGITIIEMVRKMDAGPMLAKEEIEIDEEINHQKLSDQLAHLGSKLLLRVIKEIAEGKSYAQIQDESAVTFAPKIEKAEGFLDFEGKTAFELHNQVRAISGSYTFFRGIDGLLRRVKVLKTKAVRVDKSALAPGECMRDPEQGLIVGCKSGDQEAILVVLELVEEGRGRVSGEEFYLRLSSMSKENIRFVKS